MTDQPQLPGGELPNAPTRSAGWERYRKDAAIGLAILIVLLLLWRLMTRPEQWGAFGTWARTNVFGPEGVQLAQTLGQGAGTGIGARSGDPFASASPTNATNSAQSNLTPVAALPPLPDTGQAMTEDSLLISNGVKVIPTLPAADDSGTAPLASSPEAANIASRLGQAGARGGDIQISLYWQNRNDLDLHCIDPKGEEIWFNNKVSSRTGGRLDVDANAAAPFTSQPVENIFWPMGGAPGGVYEVTVTYYDQHDVMNTTRYIVRTMVQDKACFFTNTIAFPRRQTTQWICKFRYDPTAADPSTRCRFLAR
ncbi:hypothetical protein SBV1_740006 [Verrucomicrobia bacterium]|nr:hypothetical protein SBV1_740006 [Verrucomicrobiota bacterium]